MQSISNNHATGTLNEGVVDTLKQLYQSLASKVAAIPDFKKYYNLAKSKQQETVEAIKTSATPEELKQKIASIASGLTVTEASVSAPAAAAGLAAAAGVFDIWAAQVVGIYSTAISYAAAGQTGMAVAGGVLFGVLGQLGCIGLALYFASKAAQASRSNAPDSKVSEARTSQRHPLEDHAYHKKTDAELRYIAKDAKEAATAMKDHNSKAEAKYLDQVSDSATVRNWRKTSGMPEWYKKKYGHTTDKSSSAALNEISLGNYRDKAQKSKFSAEIQHDFGSKNPALPRRIKNRTAGLGRASDRANKAAVAQLTKNRDADLANKDALEAQLKELQSEFDSHYDRSDDYSYYNKHRDIKSKITALQQRLAKLSTPINELSTDALAKYKTAAGKSASEADSKGDFKTGDKRFKGIVAATKKQFVNDAKESVVSVAKVIKNESTSAVSFSPEMIGTLKNRFNGITTVDPAGPTYKQLIKLLDSLDNAALQQLSTAGIKFVSALAKNRIKK